MMEILDLFGDVWQGVATLSLGTIGLIGLSVASYFKKGKFVLNLFDEGKTSVSKIFGEDNVNAFLLEAKNIKVGDVKKELIAFADKQLRIEKMLELILKTNLLNGVYEDTEELRQEVESLL